MSGIDDMCEAQPPPGMRNEMDSISVEYGADQAASGLAKSEPVVSVRGLVKRYGSHEAVAGIDLEVRRGEIFAFLGPNGAGRPRRSRSSKASGSAPRDEPGPAGAIVLHSPFLCPEYGAAVQTG
jgi:hypothetical protein